MTVGTRNGLLDHRQNRRVFLFKVGSEYFRIPVHTQNQLRQVIGADRKSVKELSEFVDQHDVAGNFAHDVNFKTIPAPIQAILGHDFQYSPRLLDSPAEGNHHDKVRQSHVIADPPQGLAFEGKGVPIGGMDIAGGPAESDHRVILGLLKIIAAEQ